MNDPRPFIQVGEVRVAPDQYGHMANIFFGYYDQMGHKYVQYFPGIERPGESGRALAVRAELELSEVVTPSLVLSMEHLRHLYGALKQMFEEKAPDPPTPPDLTGVLEATRAHLEDMRKLAFERYT